jgi:PAS domain S-box-containing protein
LELQPWCSCAPVWALAHQPISHQRSNSFTASLLLALAYFVTGRFGLMLPAFGSHITLIWLPTGIAVAALFRWGFGCWPGITLGSFAVNIAVGTAWPVALGIALGSTLGPVLAAWALRRTGFHPAFDRMRDIVLLAVAAVLGMLISSLGGVAALSAGALLPEGRLAAWLFWWGGDTMGVIAAAPLVFTFTRDDGDVIIRRWAGFATWLVATCATTLGVFVFNHGWNDAPWALSFVPLPFVAWAALRFGGAGTSFALIVLSVGAAYGTSIGTGPFHRANPIEGTVVLWIYMATNAVLGWLISALHNARVRATGIQRLFERALSDVSLGVLLAGLERRITFANDGFTRLTGYAEAELLDRSCSLLHGPKTDPATVKKLKKALDGDGFFDGEILNYRKDGTTFWNALLISPVHDERGVKTGFFGVQRDVTMRKQAEQALHESEERLRLAMAAASQGLYDLNIQTGECIVSPEYALMLGYDPAEFRETNAAWRERLHPEDRDTVYGAYADYVAGRSDEYRVEFRQRMKDGGWKWILSLGSLVARSADGQPLRMLGTHTDITGRKRVEEALRHQTAVLEAQANSTIDGILVVDRDGKKIFQNQRIVELWKIPKHIAEDSDDTLQVAHVMKSIRHPERFAERVTYLYSHPDETIRDEVELLDGTVLDRYSAPVTGKQGQIYGRIWTFRDITDRKRAAEALHNSAEFTKSLIGSMQDGFSVLDANGVQSDVNPAFCRMTGFAREELIGARPPYPYWPPEEHERIQAALTETMKGVSANFEMTFMRRNGERFPVIVSPSEVRNQDGSVRSYSATVRDITNRKRAEEERARLLHSLEESQVRLQTLVSNLPGMAYRCLNDPNRTMSYVSEGCEAVTGYRREELENNRVVAYGNLIHPEDREWLRAKCQASLEADTPCQNEYRITDKQGRERWVSERASGVHAPDGTLLAIDGFIQDVTSARQAKLEREQLDLKMQETQKLESLGVLAGGIAHDFNNLLTTIMGNASVATIDLPRGSPTRKCMDQITEASLRAAELCSQMLAYSGRGRFVVQKLDLGELVKQTAQMLQISVSKKAVLNYYLEKGLPPVEADATQMGQVIMNLVINASEAIGDDVGVITVSTGVTHLARDYFRGMLLTPDLPAGEYVFLEVSDTGCGMSPETLKKIFDPFFTTKFTGRGLGLAAVLGIVRGHRGAMNVTSEPGCGTSFKLFFPAAAGAAEPSKAPPAAVPEWSGSGTVLVVDDEENMRDTIALMMDTMGLDAVLAADGREAIEVFRASAGRFALVLLDLTMPNMDGEQTLAELRRISPDVRVVLMSGFNAHEVLVRFNGKGLASFLQKPFTIDSLRSTMQEVLEGKPLPMPCLKS